MANENGYLLFVWTPNGWLLEEREGELPAVGAEVEAPMPGDRRRCAYTQAA